MSLATKILSCAVEWSKALALWTCVALVGVVSLIILIPFAIIYAVALLCAWLVDVIAGAIDDITGDS